MKKCLVRFIILCKETSDIEIRTGRKIYKALASQGIKVIITLPYYRIISVSAKTKTQKQTVFYRLCPKHCQTLNLVFYPYKVPVVSIQTFTLYDKNYNLPIDGVLVFIGQ